MRGLAIAAYIAASIVFALTGLSRPERTEAWPPRTVPTRDAHTRGWLILGAGVATAIVLGVLAFDYVHRSLVRPGANLVLGPALWIASLLVLLTAVSLARPLASLPPAWTTPHWPISRRAGRVLLGTLAVLVLGACLARLVGLAHIPGGIKADEGDRAATAMSILSGNATRNIFDTGWFYISNVYFSVLALFLKVLGVGYAQARVFGGVSSVLTFVVTIWIALRHFGPRAAVLTALLGVVLGVSLQFARQTDEATPTAFLWAVSIALFLEAAREGRLWAWAGAGVAGGLSIYFYPQGRVWGALAVVLCLYFFVRLGSARRVNVLVGSLAAGLAAVLAVGPFFANIRVHPDLFFLRARQTSVFSDENPTRLAYYDPSWNDAELLWAQLKHALAIFGVRGDATEFWPTDRPVLGTTLTVLTLLGLGWFSLSWRNVPRFTLALWFWTGFAGVVVTVDTPDLERMATAVPVIPLLAAGVLDELAERLSALAIYLRPGGRRAIAVAAAGCAFLVATALAVQQGHFYFVTYGSTERWPQPTIQGQAVADQGPDALVMTLGHDYNQINSGWVRLLAPSVERGGMKSPGSALPLAIPAERDLSFLLYPRQEVYLPLLANIYPGGSVHRYTAPSEGLVVTIYRVPRSAVRRASGALAGPIGGPFVRVDALGTPPRNHARSPASLRWTAMLRVPQYGTYDVRLVTGPARLEIDGKTVLSIPRGRPPATARLALARGVHFVALDGPARSPAQEPLLEWRAVAPAPSEGTPDLSGWQRVPSYQTMPAAEARGLFGTIRAAAAHPEQRLDGTLATGTLRGEIDAGGGPFVAQWEGYLRAPRAGLYQLSLRSEGPVELVVDGRTVLHTDATTDTTTRRSVFLRAGRHPVELTYHVDRSGGRLEWSWRPPGGRESIVPPSALEPPPGRGVSTRLPADALLTGHVRDVPLVVTN